MKKDISRINKICWAQGAEGCSSKYSSKEHVISDSLLKVIGGVSMNGQHIERGRFFIKNLCANHNNRLHLYDEEAVKFYSAIKALVFNIPNKHFDPINNHEFVVNINGKYLERWFAKTFINIAIFNVINFNVGHGGIGLHAHSIIDALYSGDDFMSPFGLYLKVGQNGLSKNKVGYFNPRYSPVELIKAENKEIIKCEYPLYLHFNYLGIEIIGLYNITELNNGNVLEGPLKPAHDMLVRDNWIYRPQKFSIGSFKGPTHTPETNAQ